MNSFNAKKIYLYLNSMETEFSVERLPENTMNRSHAHDSFELYFLIDGNRRLLVKNNFYKLEKGDILLIAPGILHKTLDENPSEYHRLVINFPKRIIDNVMRKGDAYTDLISREATIVRNMKLYDVLVNDILHIENAIQNNDTQTELLIAAFLYKLIYYLSSGENILPTTEISEKNSKQISDILKYINSNYTHPITLAELSAKFYVSEFHLCRSFKKSTGRTIVEYINYLRIEKAKTILIESETTIKKAAEMSGFKSIVNFNHTFKDYEKITPSQFIKIRKMK